MPGKYVYQIATDGKKGGKGAIIRKKKRKNGEAQDPRFPMEDPPVISALMGTLPVNVGGWRGVQHHQNHQHQHQGHGQNGRGGHGNWKNWWKHNGGDENPGTPGGGGGDGYFSTSKLRFLVS